MAAGPVFNFVLSILIFGGIILAQGKVAEPLTIGALKPLPVEGVELRKGDTLRAIAGRDVPSFE